MSTPRLLILDDDVAAGELVQDIALTVGISARYLTNPKAFFNAVAETQPSHIVLDLNMPTLDGIEAMEQLAHRKCRASLIICSGVSSRVLDAAARSARDQGLSVAGVLAKPFNPDELLALLTAPVRQSSDDGTQESVEKLCENPITAEELQQGLERREFMAFFQPKISCKTGRLVGFEALSRWKHPSRGLVMPDRFINLAEESGLIGELTLQTMEQSLAVLARLSEPWQLWNALNRPSNPDEEWTMSVNLSARMLRGSNLLAWALECCRCHEISPSRLTFELTESCAFKEMSESLAMLTRLRVHGFQLSIDDFGTCYSSLSRLVEIPFTEVKIDRSFMTSLTTMKDSRSVIRSIVELGHELGLRAVAEGIEDQNALDYLQSVGCDSAQGYMISPPIPEHALTRWLMMNCPNGRWVKS